MEHQVERQEEHLHQPILPQEEPAQKAPHQEGQDVEVAELLVQDHSPDQQYLQVPRQEVSDVVQAQLDPSLEEEAGEQALQDPHQEVRDQEVGPQEQICGIPLTPY